DPQRLRRRVRFPPRRGAHRHRGRRRFRLGRTHPSLVRHRPRHHQGRHAPHGRSGGETPVMKIECSSDIPVPRERVWKAFLDPGTLARAIPGCEGLEEIGPGEYKAKMKVGVAAIKGTFEGKVRLFDLEPPNRYKMLVEGKGGPGFVKGEAAMSLSAVSPASTRVSYDADVQVGGLIASVGQRMLGGVSKMMLDQFFTRMTELLAEKK